jgi:hypothetical protein
MKHVAFAVVMFLFAVSAKATDHSIRLQISCGGDTVGWHFSRYDGPEVEHITIYGIPIGFRIGRSQYTKIERMDDGSSHGRMHRGESFDKTFTLQGPGVYLLDFSDWSNDCNVGAAITVDGELLADVNSPGIDRRGNASFNLSNWHHTPNLFGPNDRQTDDREIAFVLK